MSKFVVGDGKYSVVGYGAFRNGEYWRDLTGDKFVGALIDEIKELRDKLGLDENTGGTVPMQRVCVACLGKGTVKRVNGFNGQENDFECARCQGAGFHV